MSIKGLGGLGSTTGNQNSNNQNPQQSSGNAGLGGLGGLGGNNQNAQPQTTQQRPISNVVSLKKGQKVSLKKCAADAGVDGALSKIHVGLGWDVNKFDGSQFDLDVFTFAVKSDGKVRNTGDFVFFNNPRSPEGAIVHSGDNRTGAGSGDDEVVIIDLAKLPAETEKIVFAITINEAEARNQNFGMVDNAFVRLLDLNTNMEFLRYDLSEDYSLETAIVAGEVYNHNDEWKFKAIGSGFNNGLPALCACYGVAAE